MMKIMLVNFMCIFSVMILSAEDCNEYKGWFRMSYLGFQIGYNQNRVVLVEAGHGQLSSGLGVGGSVLEIVGSYNEGSPYFDWVTYNLLPLTIFLAKPFGRTTKAMPKGCGGPVLYPWGCQYPAALFLFARGSVLGISRKVDKTTWSLSANLGLGLEKTFHQFGSLGIEFGGVIKGEPLDRDFRRALYINLQFNISCWAKT